MKLTQLQEATYHNPRYPVIERLMKVGRKLDAKFTIDDLAWIAAATDMEHIGEANWDNQVSLRYNPPPGFKGNPDLIEEYMEFIEDIEDDDELEKQMKDWMEFFSFNRIRR
jgi:hypothetical protein